MSTRASLAAALGFAALFTGSAFAQAVIVTPDEFGPDDDVVVRDYIVRRPVGPGPIVGSIPLRPGSIVPPDVRLAPFTEAPNCACGASATSWRRATRSWSSTPRPVRWCESSIADAPRRAAHQSLSAARFQRSGATQRYS